MSSSDDSAAIIAEWDGIRTATYCALAAIGFFLWDYLVTFSDEVKWFWGKPSTGAAVLFFLNRYVCLTTIIINLIVSYGPVGTPVVCSVFSRMYSLVAIFQYFPWAGFATLRAYALSRNRALAALVLALSVVPIAINLAAQPAEGSVIVPGLGCSSADSISAQTVLAFVIASRGALVISDVLLISITWATLSRKRTMSPNNTFLHVLVRDGTIYFICLLVMNSLHLMFSVFSIADFGPLLASSSIVVFTEPLTAILVWRFMLNLQAVNSQMVDLNSHLETLGEEEDSHGDSLVFNRIIGSLGSLVIDDRLGVNDSDDTVATESVELDVTPTKTSV